MSIYSTRHISRDEAERIVILCRIKDMGLDRKIRALSDEILDNELHRYVYSNKYNDIIPSCENYMIIKSE